MAKKPTQENVKQVLDIGYFNANKREVKDTDPIEPTSWKLPIDKIEKYDRNPRKDKNPEYDSLLEALRANGQEEALTITRRPGSEKYMIKRGGNTRLEIMKMLYHEAGDTRFEQIDVLFMPWTSESDCIVGHLIENTTQGRMTLIDKARGYRNFKLEYEEEHDIESLGQRKLAALLKEKGASINHKLLGIMNYALDILEPAIPETLAGGLGKPQIEKLKRVDQTFQYLAESHQLFDTATRETQIRAEFHNLLAMHDGDEWDMDLVIEEFTQRMSKLLDKVSYQRLVYDINMCLKGDPWKVELISTHPEESSTNLEGDPQDIVTKGATTQSTDQLNIGESDDNPAAEPLTTSKNQALKPTVKSEKKAPSTEPEPHQRISVPESGFTAGEFDIKSMRSRIYTLATKFATATHVQNTILPWNYGYGYFVDLPKTPLAELMTADQAGLSNEHRQHARIFMKEREAAEHTFGWWLLWHAQGVVDFRGKNPIPGFHRVPECQMKNLLEQLYDPNEINVWKSAFSALGHIWKNCGGPRHAVDMTMAFSYIKPHNMMKYVEFIEARTQMMAHVEEHNINLWEGES